MGIAIGVSDIRPGPRPNLIDHGGHNPSLDKSKLHDTKLHNPKLDHSKLYYARFHKLQLGGYGGEQYSDQFNLDRATAAAVKAKALAIASAAAAAKPNTDKPVSSRAEMPTDLSELGYQPRGEQHGLDDRFRCRSLGVLSDTRHTVPH